MNPGTPSDLKGFIGGLCNITQQTVPLRRRSLNGFIRLHALVNFRNFSAGWQCRMDDNLGFPGLNTTSKEGYGPRGLDSRVGRKNFCRQTRTRSTDGVRQNLSFSPEGERLCELSLEEAHQLGHNLIGPEHLLLGLLRVSEGVTARVLGNLGVDPNNIRTQVIGMVGDVVDKSDKKEQNDVGGAAAGTPDKSLLEKYGINLTKPPKKGDPVVGRPEQIKRVIQILGCLKKNNPCLVGEFGVGKKVIVEGLAQQIINGDVPENIQRKEVITLNWGRLVAGTKYSWQVSDRVNLLIKELKEKSNVNVILFIEDLHRWIEEDCDVDAKRFLIPALAEGELQCIGAITPDNYKEYIEDDEELERYFEPVEVPECSIDETIQILKGLRERYEIHHKIWYTNGSLVAAAQLSDQHMEDGYLPYKAINLIDVAGSYVQIRHQKITKQNDSLVVTELDIQHVVSSLTGKPLTEIPLQKVSTDKSDKKEEDDVGGAAADTPDKSLLEEYGIKLTKPPKKGELNPVVGRSEQIQKVIQILGCLKKTNPCLVGEFGVGKKVIVEGLCQQIVSDVPENIQRKEVITLNMGSLVASWDVKERVEKLMQEFKKKSNNNVILFINDVHRFIGGDYHFDLKRTLVPALASGELQCIGATTPKSYKRYIERDPELTRLFEPVEVPEPTIDDTIQILKGLRERYEIHHKVHYTNESLVAAAQLSDQYIKDGYLPYKAINLIDEAGSYVQIRQQKITKQKDGAVEAQMSALSKDHSGGNDVPVVTELDIQHVVSSLTEKLPEKMSTDESDSLLKMEETLHKQVIGQGEAVKAISSAIRRAHVGLKNPNRPIASFFFSGPTGVGKTELAKAVAACYFGSEKAIIRLDMSEYNMKYEVARLIGSPPGYVGYDEGGQLTEAVRKRPRAVVLFDEIEKAHPDVFNIMLQILDEGRLTDGHGKTADFKNTFLIMTSNVGSSVFENAGFCSDGNKENNGYNEIKGLVNKELKKYFKPEFLNRLDEMIVFRQLTRLDLNEVAEIMLKEVVQRLKKKKIELVVTERFRDKVVDEGYDPSYGARPLRRAIIRVLEDVLAEKMIAQEIKEGDSITVDVDSDGNVMTTHKGQ